MNASKIGSRASKVGVRPAGKRDVSVRVRRKMNTLDTEWKKVRVGEEVCMHAKRWRFAARGTVQASGRGGR